MKTNRTRVKTKMIQLTMVKTRKIPRIVKRKSRMKRVSIQIRHFLTRLLTPYLRILTVECKCPKKYVPDVKLPKRAKANTERVSETNPLLMPQPLTRGEDVFPEYTKRFAIPDTSYESFLQNVLPIQKGKLGAHQKMRMQPKNGSTTYCNVHIQNKN